MSVRRSSGNKVRLLVAAPFPPPYGGATVLAEQLCRSLEILDDVQVVIVNTRSERSGTLKRAIGRLYVVVQLLRAIWSVDVASIHGSSTGLHVVAPLVVAAGYLMRTRIVLRRFGGADLLPRGRVAGWLARWAYRSADCVFVETRVLESSARRMSIENVAWLPNSRPMSDSVEPMRANTRGRFVYMGSVSAAKGIDTLLASVTRLHEDVSVDLYGEIDPGLDVGLLEASESVTYRGVVSPDRIPEILKDYSALVIPTKYAGEGYPGVIVEAYAAGIPVVATNWLSIPEIVNESTGILVSPGVVDELADALNLLTTDGTALERLRAGVMTERGRYDSSIWDREFANVVRCLGGVPTRDHD